MLYLPLKRLHTLPRFSWGALRNVAQLRRSEGLIGYSLGAELGSLEFWSLAVWEDEESLRRFVHAAPHVRVMRAMEPRVGRTEHARWKVVDGAVRPAGLEGGQEVYSGALGLRTKRGA